MGRLAAAAGRVDRVVAGNFSGSTIRVARWVILDGETLTPAKGASVPLALEPFSANSQLESIYLSNDLGASSSSPLFYDPTSG